MGLAMLLAQRWHIPLQHAADVEVGRRDVIQLYLDAGLAKGIMPCVNTLTLYAIPDPFVV